MKVKLPLPFSLMLLLVFIGYLLARLYSVEVQEYKKQKEAYENKISCSDFPNSSKKGV